MCRSILYVKIQVMGGSVEMKDKSQPSGRYLCIVLKVVSVRVCVFPFIRKLKFLNGIFGVVYSVVTGT